MNYYDIISKSYNKLYKQEQLEKIGLILPYCHGKILDVGCGPFYTSGFFEDIIGVDPSIGLLKLSKSKNIIQAKAEFLPFKSKSFETIISITSIQNFSNIKRAIEEMKRVAISTIIVTIMKKSFKVNYLRSLLKKSKLIEEEKDLIFILNLAGI